MTEDRGRPVPPHGSGGQVLSPSEPATHVTVEVAAHEIATWMERAAKAEATLDDLIAALTAARTAICFKSPPVDFGTPDDPNPCYEARVPVAFIEQIDAALAKANSEQPTLSTSEGEGS